MAQIEFTNDEIQHLNSSLADKIKIAECNKTKIVNDQGIDGYNEYVSLLQRIHNKVNHCLRDDVAIDELFAEYGATMRDTVHDMRDDGVAWEDIARFMIEVVKDAAESYGQKVDIIIKW